MTTGQPLGALSSSADAWHTIDWYAVHRTVRRLQARMVKAVQAGRWGKVRAWQHLLTHSFSGKAVAVKRVTSNDGNRTPGVDGIIWDTPEKKRRAMAHLRQRGSRAQPLRRIYIPKNGRANRFRPLSIPTMQDRAMQALYLLALDPIAETQGDPNSYGFRSERSTADAIGRCFTVLARKPAAPWILEGDIRACFDGGRPFGCPTTGLWTAHGHGGGARSSSLPPAWLHSRGVGQLGGRQTAVVRESAVPKGDCCWTADYGERVDSAKDRAAKKAYPAQSA